MIRQKDIDQYEFTVVKLFYLFDFISKLKFSRLQTLLHWTNQMEV